MPVLIVELMVFKIHKLEEKVGVIGLQCSLRRKAKISKASAGKKRMENSKEKATLSKKIEELIKEKEKFKKENYEALKKIGDARKEVEELITENSKFKAQIDQLNKDNEALADKCYKCLKEKEEAIRMVEKLKIEIAELNRIKEQNMIINTKKVAEFNNEKVYFTERIVELSKELEQAKRESKNSSDLVTNDKQASKVKIEQLTTELYSTNNRAITITEENQELIKKVEKLSSEIDTHKAQTRKEKDELSRLIKELEAKNTELSNDIIKEKSSISSMILHMTKERDDYNRKIKKLADTNLQLNTSIAEIVKERDSFDITRLRSIQRFELSYCMTDINIANSNNEIEELRKRVGVLEEENEKVIRDKESHLKESNKVLKRYSLENARLTVKLRKTLEVVGEFKNEVSVNRSATESALLSLNEDFKQFYQLFREKLKSRFSAH
eukprot:TRINITY_DN2006_c0_g2_i1.p1 TRINITY_DN2006_c0_g2~~TRINITY_DN2006_c0_g2_i1.p1  ORF type:complete len:441 (-),score=119.24 TRINITY_DN2006_c0_g2_i1:90-1412(-)